jgi:endoglucanase
MKKILLTFVCALAVIAASAITPVQQYGQLQVRGAQLCDQNGNPVTLKGVSFGWHNIWPRFYNKGAVKELVREWDATVIRAAMGIKIEDNYLENPEFALKCITPVIQQSIKEGVYVIIDWHAHEMYTDKAKEFFGKMAQQYGKYPNIIYELFNEPVNDSWESLKVYHKTIIDEIRRYDPDNIVLCGCPHWDQDIDIVAKSPIEGVSNVMYTVHFYAATHKDYLRNKMTDAVKGGLPVFVSECAAMEASGNGPLDETEWQKWVDTMNSLKISFACWSLSDKDETCSMLLPRAKADGKWTPDLIKPWGKIVRSTLAK